MSKIATDSTSTEFLFSFNVGQNEPQVEEKSPPELVAGFYLSTPSSSPVIVHLSPAEEYDIPWYPVGSDSELADTAATGESIKPGQEWFWAKEWQAAEREAEEDLAEGRFEVFDNDEDFLASLV